MKHTAPYLDSGFFTISPRAAGALARASGKQLPRHGFQIDVFVNGARAVLQRTNTCLLRRKWHWSIHGMPCAPSSRAQSPAQFTT